MAKDRTLWYAIIYNRNFMLKFSKITAKFNSKQFLSLYLYREARHTLYLKLYIISMKNMCLQLDQAAVRLFFKECFRDLAEKAPTQSGES